MKKIISLLLLSLCVIISILALPTTVQATTLAEPTSISFKNAPLTSLGVGETHQLVLTATPANSSTKCTWTISDKKIATVDSKGLVTAKQQGTATITVKTTNNITKSCTITVKNKPRSIKLTTNNLILGASEIFNIDHILPENTASYKVTYTSSNKNVATVGLETGLVTSKNCGTTNITAKTYNGITTTCKVTVKPLPYWIKFKTPEIKLGVGDTHTLEHYYPNGTYSLYDVTYSSNNPDVAAVNKTTGVVTAKSIGTALITVKTRNGLSTTCSINVKKAPDGIHIFEPSSPNSKYFKLAIGEKLNFDHVFSNDTYSNDVIYYSETPFVADVTNKFTGEVIAKNFDSLNNRVTTKIFVKTKNGKTDYCIVEVSVNPYRVFIRANNRVLSLGEKMSINNIYDLEGAASYHIKYTSSNPNVVAIDENNDLVAKKLGTSTITITTHNGKTGTCKITVKDLPSKITLNQKNITLGIGDRYDLDYKLADNNAQYVRDRIVFYKKSDSDRIILDTKSGMITANKVGQETVYVKTHNGKTDSCIVTVKPTPYWIKLNRTGVTLGANGDTVDLNHSIPSGTACNNIRYYSSNTSVATVNATSGYVTAKKAGTAMITVKTHQGISTCCQITVKAAPYRVQLNTYNKTLKVKQSYNLDHSFPGGMASNKTTYVSSNPNVVSVDKTSGVITAKKTGVATITVSTYNNVKAICKVTVKK